MKMQALALMLALALLGCGSSNSSSSASFAGGNPAVGGFVPPRLAPEVPELVLTSPAGSRQFATSQASVNLRGLASSPVQQVRISTGGTSSAVLPNWSLDNVPLSPGDNQLQVVGNTANGQVTLDLVVTRNTGFLVGALNAQPRALLTGRSTPVDFAISLQNAPGLDSNSVQLLQDGVSVATLTPDPSSGGSRVFRTRLPPPRRAGCISG